MTIAQKIAELAEALGVDIPNDGQIADNLNAITLAKGGTITSNTNISEAIKNLANTIGGNDSGESDDEGNNGESSSSIPFMDFYFGDPDDSSRDSTLIINEDAYTGDSPISITASTIKYFFDDDEEHAETASDLATWCEQGHMIRSDHNNTTYVQFIHFYITDHDSSWNSITVVAYNNQNEEIGRVTVPRLI